MEAEKGNFVRFHIILIEMAQAKINSSYAYNIARPAILPGGYHKRDSSLSSKFLTSFNLFCKAWGSQIGTAYARWGHTSDIIIAYCMVELTDGVFSGRTWSTDRIDNII